MELKPCPFCGSEVIYLTFTSYFDPEDTVCVFCNSCKSVVTVESNEAEGINDRTKAEAIAAWNTRAERTCRDSNKRFNAWQCSECGATLLLMSDDYGEPSLSVDGVASVPSYCPNCGAKVVEE